MIKPRRRSRSLAVPTVVALAVAACAGGSGNEQILVSAAASLTDAFTEMEAAFEAGHHGANVTLNLSGSSALREQLLEGAPVDVFASANTTTMDQVVAAGRVVGAPTVFAHNTLQIAVPAGNPGNVMGLADFADTALLIGLCAQAVPCGDLARHVLDNAGVVPSVDTNEPDVRALLTKIEFGELDAGIVYVTDVAASNGAVVGIAIPDDVNVVADYPIAVLSNAANPVGAAAFVAFVMSADGRAILGRHGFGTP